MDNPTSFNAYSRYYEAFYADKDYEKETAWVVRLIREHDASATTVLELGCGTGGHAEFLSAHGFEVVGLDRSEQMIAQATQKGLKNFEPLVGDITSFTLPTKFDVALSLFHVVSYLTTNEQLIGCFRTVHAHLRSGGFFIFDVWYSPAVYAQRPETRVKRRLHNGSRITRLAEPSLRVNENVVDVNYEVIVENAEDNTTSLIHEKHSMRHFGLPEIELLGRLTGFDLLSAQESFTGERAGTHTWGVCFVLRKKG